MYFPRLNNSWELLVPLLANISSLTFAQVSDMMQEEFQHVSEHLENVEMGELTDAQRLFHYFRLYDANRDRRLDGLEILRAINHQHGQPEEGMSTSRREDVLEPRIDDMLAQTDLNDDGFVDWVEYTHFVKTKFSSPPTPPV